MPGDPFYSLLRRTPWQGRALLPSSQRGLCRCRGDGDGARRQRHPHLQKPGRERSFSEGCPALPASPGSCPWPAGSLAGGPLPGCQLLRRPRSALGSRHMVCGMLTGSRSPSSGEGPQRGKHWQVVLLGTFRGLLEDCLPTGPGHLAECLHLAYGLWFLLGNSGLAKVFILLSEQRGAWHLSCYSLRYCAVLPLSSGHPACERPSLCWAGGSSEVRSFLSWSQHITRCRRAVPFLGFAASLLLLGLHGTARSHWLWRLTSLALRSMVYLAV